jgi:hypothetical protein
MAHSFPKNAVLIAALFCVAATALAQETSPQRETDDTVQTFKVDVNVVNVFFNVKDKHGLLISSLAKDQFEIYEDGKL